MYSPPIKYGGDFLQKFPTEADAFQFYQTYCGIYCSSCGENGLLIYEMASPTWLTAKNAIRSSRY